MPIARHRYVHTDARLPSARIPQFVVCDLQAELPTVDVGEGDTAYAKDSDKLFKRTASAWFEIAGGGGSTVTASKTFVVHNPPVGSTNYPLWEAEQAVTIIKVRSYMIGSGSCGVNVTKNGVDVLGADQSPSSSWGSSAVLSTAVAAGDDVDVEVRNVAGTVSYLVVQVDYTKVAS